jgi:hypothetical protein
MSEFRSGNQEGRHLRISPLALQGLSRSLANEGLWHGLTGRGYRFSVPPTSKCHAARPEIMLTNEGRKLIAASNLVAASVSRLVAARVILANLIATSVTGH